VQDDMKCHSEPFAFCHSEAKPKNLSVQDKSERIEESQRTAQDKLREESRRDFSQARNDTK